MTSLSFSPRNGTSVPAPSPSTPEEVASAVAAAAGAADAVAAVRPQERATWLDNLIKLNWDMDLQTNAVLTGDADFTLRRLYVTTANRNGYANPELDKLLIDAAGTVDQKKRADMYAQADKIIWDDAVGIFPFELLENFVASKKVSGFVPPANGIPSFANVTVQK